MEERTIVIRGKTRRIVRRSLKDEKKDAGIEEKMKQERRIVRCSRCNRVLKGYDAAEGMCDECKIAHRREYFLWARGLHLYPGPFQ